MSTSTLKALLQRTGFRLGLKPRGARGPLWNPDDVDLTYVVHRLLLRRPSVLTVMPPYASNDGSTHGHRLRRVAKMETQPAMTLPLVQ